MTIDLESFRNYYDSYYEQLCRFLNRYSHDSQVIEDVLQEVFLRLWENRHSIEVEYVKTYLFHAAKNQILNYLRNEQNRHYLLEKWFNEQLETKQGKDCFDIEKFTSVLDMAINCLPEKCRDIFILNRRENYSYKQIAELKGISVKTIENQMGIAMKKIRDFMTSYSFSFFFFFF